jgi:hypothetical protein
VIILNECEFDTDQIPISFSLKCLDEEAAIIAKYPRLDDENAWQARGNDVH